MDNNENVEHHRSRRSNREKRQTLNSNMLTPPPVQLSPSPFFSSMSPFVDPHISGFNSNKGISTFSVQNSQPFVQTIDQQAALSKALDATPPSPLNARRLLVRKKRHTILKRQYFKPSIDGSMLSNQRVQLLKASSNSTGFDNLETTTRKTKITVHSLVESLFQLFDRIKAVLRKALEEHDAE